MTPHPFKRVTQEELKAIISKSESRKARRVARKSQNADLKAQTGARIAPGRAKRPKKRPGTLKSSVKRSTLKAQIIRLLGLLDRKINGPLCRLGAMCPDYEKIGIHNGSLAYHIVPAQRGDSTRFVPENVVWACRVANYGEVMNRSLYRSKHIVVFGPERLERLENMAREIRQYTLKELWDLRAELKAKIEAPK